MLPLLLTTTNEKQPDCVVAWDLLGGSPIATLSGESAQPASLTAFYDGVVCAAARKPFIQTWNFQTANSAYRRILTKSLVTSLTFTPDGDYIFVAFGREVYVYQTSSGCLMAVLEGSHSANIGEMKMASSEPLNPSLLVTADTSGFLACWSLTGLMDNLTLLSASSFTPVADSNDKDNLVVRSNVKHAPLWYSIHTSRGLPRCTFMRSQLLVVGSEGLKIFDLFDGTVLGIAFTEILGGLHSICVTSCVDGRIFCGGSNGLLYVAYMKGSQNQLLIDKEVRRCFVNSKLPSAQKTISELLSVDGHPNLLVVGSRGGLVEVLRTDSVLTCVQQFSVLNATLSNDPLTTCQLTGLCVTARPNWLSASSSTTEAVAMHGSASVQTEEEERGTVSQKYCGIEPFKRHYGWRLDDLVRLRLPCRSETIHSVSHLDNVYMDDFKSFTMNDESHLDPCDHSHLQTQVDKLTPRYDWHAFVMLQRSQVTARSPTTLCRFIHSL